MLLTYSTISVGEVERKERKGKNQKEQPYLDDQPAESMGTFAACKFV